MRRLLLGLLAVFVASAASTQTNQMQMQHSTAMKPGAYLDYSARAFEAAADQKRLLFFKATWCPTCRAADRDINTRLQDVPEGLVIFKVDYDKEGALKARYGVVRQHTFVLVDAKGAALRRWSGGGLAEIVANTR